MILSLRHSVSFECQESILDTLIEIRNRAAAPVVDLVSCTTTVDGFVHPRDRQHDAKARFKAAEHFYIDKALRMLHRDPINDPTWPRNCC